NYHRPDKIVNDLWLYNGETARNQRALWRMQLRFPNTSQSLPSQGWTAQTMPTMGLPKGHSTPHRQLRQLPPPLQFVPSQRSSLASFVFHS
ncbi:MAG TPA: hypothetical protein VGP12_05180, partial [Nitrosospira sp.]|nr:hypothetical protein [Nitrosospira sp.]